MINKNIKSRRQSKNPALRNVLYALEVGASVKVKGAAVVQMANNLSRTTKKHDNTRFSVKSLSDGSYKVTRVRAEKTPTYKATKKLSYSNLQAIAHKLRDLVREEIALIESLN